MNSQKGFRKVINVTLLLLLLAIALTIVSGIQGKIPLWIPVLLIEVILLLRFIPL
jgi:hypothetical protein